MPLYWVLLFEWLDLLWETYCALELELLVDLFLEWWDLSDGLGDLEELGWEDFLNGLNKRDTSVITSFSSFEVAKLLLYNDFYLLLSVSAGSRYGRWVP